MVPGHSEPPQLLRSWSIQKCFLLPHTICNYARSDAIIHLFYVPHRCIFQHSLSFLIPLQTQSLNSHEWQICAQFSTTEKDSNAVFDSILICIILIFRDLYWKIPWKCTSSLQNVNARYTSNSRVSGTNDVTRFSFWEEVRSFSPYCLSFANTFFVIF